MKMIKSYFFESVEGRSEVSSWSRGEHEYYSYCSTAHESTGTGIDHLIPHASLEVLSVLKKLLRYDPEERITARHGYLFSREFSGTN